MPDRVVIHHKVGSRKAPATYYWRYEAPGCHVLADGAQGYSRRIDALAGARRVIGAPLGPKPDLTFNLTISGERLAIWQVQR